MQQNYGPPASSGKAARWDTRPQFARPTFRPFQGSGILERIAMQNPQMQQPTGLLNTDYSDPPP